jgi:hypothetical protein
VAARQTGEQSVQQIDQQIKRTAEAGKHLDYLIGVHEKLMKVPIYGSMFDMDWLDLNTSVSGSLNELDSAYKKQKERYSTNLSRLGTEIANLQSNINLISPCLQLQLQLMASPELFPEEGAWNYGPESVRRAEIGHAFLCIQDKTKPGSKEDCFGFYPKKRGKTGGAAAGDPNGQHVFEVESGEEIAFSAEGRWCWGRGSTECSDANGTPGRPTSAELPVALQGQYFGKLIGRIGNELFPIGSHAVITTESNGMLYVLMNDRVGFYSDNSGELTVKVWSDLTPSRCTS